MTLLRGQHQSRTEECAHTGRPTQGKYHAKEHGREETHLMAVYGLAAASEQIPFENTQKIQPKEDYHQSGNYIHHGLIFPQEAADGACQCAHCYKDYGKPTNKSQRPQQGLSCSAFSTARKIGDIDGKHTMRPILEDGSWGDKQKKIYALDADGNKIRKKNGQYKCTTQDVTGWNSRENARKWRKDLADTINAVNDKNGLRENFWEHRSFAEQGLDTIPQIHLGEKASALERAGIQTERGNVNRRIMEQNKAILTAKMLVAKAEEELQKLVNSKPVEAVRNTANEVLDMIRAVVGKKGRLELPVIKSKYLRKISQRQSLQEQERMERFVVANQIESFEQLQEFKTQREPAYEKLSAERQQLAEQIARLEQLLVAYSDYEPYIVYHKTSNSLKGFAKRKYDKEHETELREYDSYRAKLKKMLSSDEKITPKKWTAEKAKLEEQLQESNPDYARVVTELASTEVIEHNHKMLAMTREAEQNQRSQIHSRKKNEQSL